MKKNIRAIALLSAAVIGLVSFAGCSNDSDSSDGGTVTLTNVSYDPTRELYEAYNEIFAQHWNELTGQEVEITQSHGGSGKQALEVANGLEADVVTLALEYDVNAVRDAGLIEDGWVSEFPNDSSPYTSTIVFLVRKGNPKDIHDWDDLIKEDVGIITPGVSILAQPSVAVVDKVVDKRGTRDAAEEYLNFLYSDEAQRIAGDNYYRPYNETILNEYADVFDLNVDLVTIADFGGWDEAQSKHFADGGVFDEIYEGK